MAFASVYVPNFMVQAVVRAEPDLRDRGVALVEGSPPLWTIVAANESALQAAIELAERASRVSLRPNISVASNIEVAIHAARGFAGITLIPPGEEPECLAP